MTAPDNDVLGYITPCEVCGQRVITRTAHEVFVCPPCAEVAEPVIECLCPPRVIGSVTPCPIHAQGMSMLEWLAIYPQISDKNSVPIVPSGRLVVDIVDGLGDPAELDEDEEYLRGVTG